MPFNRRILCICCGVFCRSETKTTFFWGVVVGTMLTWRVGSYNKCLHMVTCRCQSAVEVHSILCKNEQQICRLFVRLVQRATYIWKEKCLGRNSVWLDLHVQLFFSPEILSSGLPPLKFFHRCAKIKHTLPETNSKRTWMVGRLVRRSLVSFCGPAYFQG